MGVMSFRIDDKKRKAIKVIASLERKTISGIVGELSEGYIQEKTALRRESGIMKLSESSFMEWDNEEDEIYNNL